MSRRWAFTINNFTLSDWFAVKCLAKLSVYTVCGEEEAPTTGTPHLQGYMRFSSAKTMQQMSKHLPRARLQEAYERSNDIDNKVYCSKGKNIFEYGVPSESRQGQRTDIKEITDMIKNGSITLEELMFEYPDMYLKYSRAIKEMFATAAVPRSNPPEVHWRWGLSGTGKTRFCVEKHPCHYIKDGTPWWDNYRNQEAIIIDDFDNNIPFRTLLRILDRYQYQGQIKGGYVNINSPYIYITCEFPPQHYWEGNELEQVLRRLSSITEVI